MSPSAGDSEFADASSVLQCTCHIGLSKIDPRPLQALLDRASAILPAAQGVHGISGTDTSGIGTKHHTEASEPGLLGDLS